MSAVTADPFAGFRTAMTSAVGTTVAPGAPSTPKESADPLVNFGMGLPDGKDYSCLLPPNIPIDDREELGSCASTTAAAPLSASLTKDPTSPPAECLDGSPLPPANTIGDIAPVTKTAPATPVTPTIATPSPIANPSPIAKQSPPLAPAKPSYMPGVAPVSQAGSQPKQLIQTTQLQNRPSTQAAVAPQAPARTASAPNATAFTPRPAQQPAPAAAPTAPAQQYLVQYAMNGQMPQTASVPAGYYQVAPTAMQQPQQLQQQPQQPQPQQQQQGFYYATSNGYYYAPAGAQQATMAQSAVQSPQVYYAVQNPATGQYQYVAGPQAAQQMLAPSQPLQQYLVASPQGYSAAPASGSQPMLTYNPATGATSYAMSAPQPMYYTVQQPASVQPASSPSVAYYTYGPTAQFRR